MRKIIGLVCFLTLFPLLALAEGESERISVTGHGAVEAVPDMATITLGVTQQAKTAAEALSAVSMVSNAIFLRLEATGIASRDMQTSNLNLHPLMANLTSVASNPPSIVGYNASNMVTIRVRDLSKLGGMLDAVSREGANEFNGLRFGLQEPEPSREQARIAAVHDAMKRARTLADAAGVTLGSVISISEAGVGNAPMMMARGAASFDAMPVAAGELSITANVSMVFSIAD